MILRGLYAITDSQLLGDGRLLSYCQAALEGGARLLQYRDKSTDHVRRFEEASSLAELCDRYQAQLIINDDLALATKLNAGLHLGQDDGSLAQARATLGPGAVIGRTCHDRLDLADQASADGASYLAFGRFYPSSSKPQAPSAPAELLQQARKRYTLPITAIGGITLENASRLITLGADLLAVIHSLFAAASATEVERRAQAFSTLFLKN